METLDMKYVIFKMSFLLDGNRKKTSWKHELVERQDG